MCTISSIWSRDCSRTRLLPATLVPASSLTIFSGVPSESSNKNTKEYKLKLYL